MKKIVFTLTIVLIIVQIQSQDFRKAKWNSSIDEVKSTEEAEWIQDETKGLDYIYFDGVIVGNDALIVYYFFDNQLVKGKYILSEKHSNENDYLSDFKEIQKVLLEKYPTAKKEEIWKNDLYQDDYSHYGFAISIGHYVLYTSIELEQTTITQMISGDNYKISNVIEYLNKPGWQRYKDYKQKQSSDDL